MANTTHASDVQNLPPPGFEDEDFAAMLEESFKAKGGSGKGELKENEIVKGTVVAVNKDYVVVDIGYKSEGQVAIKEFQNADGKSTSSPATRSRCWSRRAKTTPAWSSSPRRRPTRCASGTRSPPRASVTSWSKAPSSAASRAGSRVDIGVKAFLPGSQVDLRPIRNLDKLIGEKFKFKVIKFNKKRGNIVLSRRVLLEKEREELKKDTLEKLQGGRGPPGHGQEPHRLRRVHRPGRHRRPAAHHRHVVGPRRAPDRDARTSATRCASWCSSSTRPRERVSLGLKQIQEDPWACADGEVPGRHSVKGKVVSLTDYGAFIELEPGVEGLVHISEMSWTKRVKHPSKIMRRRRQRRSGRPRRGPGRAKRISLGMKQIEPNPWTLARRASTRSAPSSAARCSNVTDFGIFVGVEEGIDGLVHI